MTSTWTTVCGVRLAPSLVPGGEGRAVELLRSYFGPESRYSGGQWDSFDPSGTREASAYDFTADDVAACALLSAALRGDTVVSLLLQQHDELAQLLRAIGPDRDFVDLVNAEGEDYQPVRALYRALRGLPFVGETRATKLLARKRPRLVPIIDSVIKRSAFGGSPWQWGRLHRALRADDRRLHRRLLALRELAGLDDSVGPLRIFDVLAWMEGAEKR